MKRFCEVFPHFQATVAEEALVACLLVERVCVSDDMSRLTVYVVSRSFAERTAFQALAEELKEQLFGKRKVLVEIRERFQLGGDFTPEQLFRAYRESLLAELKSRSLIAARILENGTVRFPSPEVLCCEVEDMPLNRRVLLDLKRYLEEEVFLGRCGIPMEFRADYVPYERKKLEEVPAEALAVRSREESEEEGFFLAGEEGIDSTEANTAQPTIKSRTKRRQRRKSPKRKKRQSRQNTPIKRGTTAGRSGSLRASCAAPTIRTCSTAEILKTTLFRFPRLRRSWEKLRYAEKSLNSMCAISRRAGVRSLFSP